MQKLNIDQFIKRKTRYRFYDATYHVGTMAYFVRVQDVKEGWLWGTWFDKEVYEMLNPVLK